MGSRGTQCLDFLGLAAAFHEVGQRGHWNPLRSCRGHDSTADGVRETGAPARRRFLSLRCAVGPWPQVGLDPDRGEAHLEHLSRCVLGGDHRVGDEAATQHGRMVCERLLAM